MAKRLLSLMLSLIMAVCVISVVGDPTAVYAEAITTAGNHTLTTANTYKAYTYDHFNGIADHDISQIFDGDDTTYWQAGYHEARESAQIIIDRGEGANPFNRVEIVFQTYNTCRIALYGANRIADAKGSKSSNTTNGTYKQWTSGTLPTASGTIADNIVLDNLSEPNDAYEIYNDSNYKREATSGNDKTLTIKFDTCTKRYVMLENEIYMDHDQEAEYQLAIAEIKFYFDVPQFRSVKNSSEGNTFGNIPGLRNTGNSIITSYGLDIKGADNQGQWVKNFDSDWYIYPYAYDGNNNRITDEYFLEWRIADVTYGDNPDKTAGDSVKTAPEIDPKTGKIKVAKKYWGTFNVYVKNTVTGTEDRRFFRISEGNDSSGNLAKGKKAWNVIDWNRYHDLSGNGSIKENGTVIDPYTLVNGTPKSFDYESSPSIKYAVDGVVTAAGAYDTTNRLMKVYTMGSHGGGSGPIIKINTGSTTNKTPYNYYTFYLGKSRSYDGFYVRTGDTLDATEPSATGSSSTKLTASYTSTEYAYNTDGSDNTLYSQSGGTTGKANVVSHYMPFNTRTDTYVQPTVSLPSTNTGALNQIVETVVEYYPPSRITFKTPETVDGPTYTKTVDGVTESYTNDIGFMGGGFREDMGIMVRNSDRKISEKNDIIFYLPESYEEDSRFTFTNGWEPKVKIEVDEILGGFSSSDTPYTSRSLVNSARTYVDNTMLSQLNWYLGEVEGTTELNGVKLEKSSDGGSVTLTFTEDCVPHTLKLTCYWGEYGYPRVQQVLEIPVKYTSTSTNGYNYYYTFEGFGGHSIMNGVNGRGSDMTLSTDKGWASTTWVWGDHGACTGTAYLVRNSGFNINKMKIDMAQYNTKAITVHGVTTTDANYKLPDFTDESVWRPTYQEATDANGNYIYIKHKAGYKYYIRKGTDGSYTEYTCNANTSYTDSNGVTVNEGDYVDLNGNYLDPTSLDKVQYLIADNWTGGFDANGVGQGTYTGITGYEARHEVANDGNRAGDFTFLTRLPGTKQYVNYLGGHTFYGTYVTKADTHPDYKVTGALPYSTHRLTNEAPFENKINIPIQRLGGANSVYAIMYESGVNNLTTVTVPGETASFADCFSPSLIWEFDPYITYPRDGQLYGLPNEYKLGYYPENTLDLWVDLTDVEGDVIEDDYTYEVAEWYIEEYDDSTSTWKSYTPNTPTDPELKLLNKYGRTNTIQFRYAEAGKFRVVCKSVDGIKDVYVSSEFTLQNPSAYQEDAYALEANINGPLPVELVIPQPGGTVSYEPSIAISATDANGNKIEDGKQYILYISHLFAKANWSISGDNLRDITINEETGLVTIGPDAVAGEFKIHFTVAKETYDGQTLTGEKTIKLVKADSDITTPSYYKEASFDIEEEGTKLTKPKDLEIIEGNFGIGEYGQYTYFTPDYSTFDNNGLDLANGGFDMTEWSTDCEEIEIDRSTGQIAVPANTNSRYFPVTLTGTKRIYTMNEEGAVSNNKDDILDRNDGFTDIKVSQLYWVQIGEPFTVLDPAGTELTKDSTYTVSSGEKVLTITNDNANTEGYAIAALYEIINGAPKLIEAKSVKATESAAISLTVPDRKGQFEVRAYQIMTDEYYDDNIPAIYPYSSPRAYPITHN